jgi:hypothetical protein
VHLLADQRRATAVSAARAVGSEHADPGSQEQALEILWLCGALVGWAL